MKGYGLRRPWQVCRRGYGRRMDGEGERGSPASTPDSVRAPRFPLRESYTGEASA